MLIIALDTATSVCTVALGTEERILAELNVFAPRQHMEVIFPHLDYVLKEANCKISEVQGIAVGLGPGSFTGVRIGVSSAKALAQAGKIPIIGVSTLDAIAKNAGFYEGLLCVTCDARRGEVYTATYQFFGDNFEVIPGYEYQALLPETLCEKLLSLESKLVIVGDGLEKYGKLFEKELGGEVKFMPASLWYPKAANLILLTASRFLRGEKSELFKLAPTYARLSDAETLKSQKR